MTTADDDSDGRRSNRHHRSYNGRSADRRSSNNTASNNTTSSSNNKSRSSRSSSLRSQHTLPKDYISPSSGIQRSPGAPPPPPPRGRNSSLHAVRTGTAGVGNNNSRGRSLSSIAKKKSSRSQSRSRHGEEKKDAAVDNSNRRGRSLSLARSKIKKTSKPLSNSESSSSDEKGSMHRSRSRSRSKPRERRVKDSRSRSRQENTAAGNSEPPQQKSSKLVMAENRASSPRYQNFTSNEEPFKQVMSENAHRSRRTDRSTSRSRNNKKADASRKFVVEIGDNNEIMQLFEFSERGALPPSSSKSNQKMLIENIRQKYNSPETPSSSSRGRSTSRSRQGSRSTPKEDESTTRKIVVETNVHDSILQVNELSDNTDVRPTRDESPFTKRDAYAHPSEHGASLQKMSRPSSTRATSSSKAHVGGTLRPSLRSSTGLSRSTTSQASVRFTLGSEGSSKVAGLFQDEDNESEDSSLLSWSTNFMMGEQDSISVASQEDHPAANCPPYGTSPAFDTSETSEDFSSSSRRSVRFLMDKSDDRERPKSPTRQDVHQKSRSSGKSALDSSERSDESTSRRSVSFLMDQDINQVRALGVMFKSITAQSCGRSAITRSTRNEGDMLGSSRQARPLSTGLVINDTSSMTAGSHGPTSPSSRVQSSAMSSPTASDRGRALIPTPRTPNVPITSPTSPPQSRGRSPAMSKLMASSQVQALVPTKTRSLSRTRVAPIRDHIDFDPPVASTQRNTYERTSRRGALPYEKLPVQRSYSTTETFISALTIDEEDLYFVNQTSEATHEEDPDINFMNSTLTIFESECDDEDQSLLSDPASLMDPQSLVPTKQPASSDSRGVTKNRQVKVHIMEDDDDIITAETSKQERRSRIRRIISRRAAGKRRTKLAGSNLSLNVSEETRERVDMDGSGSPPFFMESAENSLLQNYTQSENGSSGKHKSRLSRLLHR